MQTNTDIIFTEKNEQNCQAKIIGRAGKATVKYKTSYNIEYKKHDQLTGQQAWIDTSACEKLEIIQKENIQETDLKNDIYNSQNTTEEIFSNSTINFTAAKMKELL